MADRADCGYKLADGGVCPACWVRRGMECTDSESDIQPSAPENSGSEPQHDVVVRPDKNVAAPRARRAKRAAPLSEQDVARSKALLALMRWFIDRRKRLLGRVLGRADKRMQLERRLLKFAERAVPVLLNFVGCPNVEPVDHPYPFSSLGDDEQQLVHTCCAYFERVLEASSRTDEQLDRELAALARHAPFHIWEAENNLLPDSVVDWADKIASSFEFDQPGSPLVARSYFALVDWLDCDSESNWHGLIHAMHCAAEAGLLRSYSERPASGDRSEWERTLIGSLTRTLRTLPRKRRKARIESAAARARSTDAGSNADLRQTSLDELKAEAARLKRDGRIDLSALAETVLASITGVNAKTIKRTIQDHRRGMPVRRPEKKTRRGRPPRVTLAQQATRDLADLMARAHEELIVVQSGK